MTAGREGRTNEDGKGMQRCLVWAFIPVFGFFVFTFMADNSGEDRYRRLGRVFCVFSLLSFGIAVSGDLLIYLGSLTGGRMGAVYARSVVVAGCILIPVVYAAQIIRMLTLRSEYNGICALKHADEENGKEEINRLQKVDINNCSREELMALPGIDAPLAIRIIKDRDETGGFGSVDELIDRYEIKPHFAAGIEESAFAGDDSGKAQESAGAFGVRKIRRIDI